MVKKAPRGGKGLMVAGAELLLAEGSAGGKPRVLPPVQLSDVNSLANQHLAFTIIEAGWAAPQLTTYSATRFNLLGITQRELHP